MIKINQALSQPSGRAALGLIALMGCGALVAPQTLSISVFVGIAPFIAVLALAALGQHLVIQQRGFDLSVAGSISLAAVLVTTLPAADAGGGMTTVAVIIALFAGAIAGAANGLIITFIGVSPLVTSIGVNAVLLGLTLYLSGGVPSTASHALIEFANSRIAGTPSVFIVSLILILLGAFVLKFLGIGRRFIAVGVNPSAASALAIPVKLYQVGTYILAGICFASAGVVLAGVMVTPTVFSGAPYMLTTIAAVVVGGSPLNGDRGSVLATFIGAVFLSYLDQLVISLGFEASMQNIVQAVIILAGVALPVLAHRIQRA